MQKNKKHNDKSIRKNIYILYTSFIIALNNIINFKQILLPKTIIYIDIAYYNIFIKYKY